MSTRSPGGTSASGASGLRGSVGSLGSRVGSRQDSAAPWKLGTGATAAGTSGGGVSDSALRRVITPKGTQLLASGSDATRSLYPWKSGGGSGLSQGLTGIQKRTTTSSSMSKSVAGLLSGSRGSLSSSGLGSSGLSTRASLLKSSASSLSGGSLSPAGSQLSQMASQRWGLDRFGDKTTLSSMTPSLNSSGRLEADSFDTYDAYCDYSDHYYGGNCYPGYGYYPYGYCYSYPYSFGFSFGFGFGYPYWGYSFGFGFGYGGYPYYGYGGYYPYSCVSIAYPYVGYYSVYPYPYLAACAPYYGCDFYGGYYVRFGYHRASYYTECSGYGCHDYDCHHSHCYDCPSHGSHYYHVRDCSQCYPSGGGYVYDDVDIPEVAAAAPVPAGVSASPTATDSSAQLPAGEAASESTTGTPALDVIPLEREEAFFASLRPAQLSFVMGFLQLQHGEYDEAVESLYSASIEDPRSRLVKLFLGISLTNVGEYGFAAEYLRLALDGWDTYPSYRWNVEGLYPTASELASQIALLEAETRLNPSDPAPLFVLSFLELHSGDTAAGAAGFERLRAISDDPLDHTLAERFLQPSLEARDSSVRLTEDEVAPPTAEDDAVQAFLANLSLRDVPALPIR